MPVEVRSNYSFSDPRGQEHPVFVGGVGTAQTFLRLDQRITTRILRDALPANVLAQETNQVSFLEARLSRLQRETSSSDWDFPSAERIPAAAWERVRSICRGVADSLAMIPDPFVSAARDGSIHLRWSKQGEEFWLELSDREAFWTRMREGSPVVTGDFDPRRDLAPQIVAALR
jgi:hypothetical protein